MLRVHRFLPFTRAEGPGERACVWVQGCPIHCPGCAVPGLWPEDGGEEVAVDDLVARVLAGPPVEGITFLGGEPFAQAEPLAHLGRTLQDAGLSVVTFTGYVLEDLRQSPRKDWCDLLEVTDLLIDGPYRRDQADLSRPWVGSANQRYHFLMSRYRQLEPKLATVPNRLEIRLESDGSVRINGMASLETLEQIAADIGCEWSG